MEKFIKIISDFSGVGVYGVPEYPCISMKRLEKAVTNSLRGSKINPTWSSQFVLMVDVSLSTVVSAPIW